MARVVVDEIVTEYELDPKGYIAGTAAVSASNSKLKQSATAVQGFGASLASGLKSAAVALPVIGAVIIGTVAAVESAVSGLAGAFQDFAGFESMTKGLEAVEGSATSAAAAMARLQEIAKAPGLGFEEAVRGYAGLRRQGLSQAFSQNLVQQAGNANALAGGGQAELSQLLRAFTQIAAKPFLQGDELLQLNEGGIAAQPMLQRQFGTSDTEQLKRMGVTARQALAAISAELALLPRVSGGAKNSIENLQNALKMASVQVGGVVAQELTPILESFGTAVENVTNANVFADAMKRIAESLGVAAPGVKGFEMAIVGVTTVVVSAAAYIGSIMGSLQRIIQNPMSAIEELRSMIPRAIGAQVTAASSFLKESALRIATQEPASLGVPSNTESGGGNPPPGESPIPYLGQIEKNTSKLNDIADAIMGGGTIGSRGISRAEISELSGGRLNGRNGIRSLMEQLGRELEVAFYSQSAQQVTRREV